jgi:hypothetical protein
MRNSLAKGLRNLLARVTLEAREAAEQAARSALEHLAVHEKDYRPHMSGEQRQLRNRLRERGRALGDTRDERTGRQDIRHLIEDVAYEHWHRLLFTRLLAENGLLHTDASHGNVPITLAECEELASELGARDGFELACWFASEILPAVFRLDDPVFKLTFAVNDQVELRKQLQSLPQEVFTADDALGWTYQFWQSKRKDEVNTSGRKIGADELPAVTQLFTEDYMVEFLLHNTLGAWWAGKLGPIAAATEAEARVKAALPAKDGLAVFWTYLRLVQDKQRAWRPAAGMFEEWPKTAKDITLLDPCMGSGHFLAFALPILARLRMENEKLTVKAALHAVVRDNLHGLELDTRCAQIGAFNVALTTWKLGGYQPLPRLQVACSGLAPQIGERHWLSLARSNEGLKQGMARLYRLFRDAPLLGSLINPRTIGGDLLEAEFSQLQPLLEKTLAQEAEDDIDRELAVTAQGLARAANILTRQFTLVATNVPYLGQKRQDDGLKAYCRRLHPDAKADLATCFVERSLEFCAPGCTTALVTPQNWMFLSGYKTLRTKLLLSTSWRVVARLGAQAFETIGGEVVNVSLLTLTRMASDGSNKLFGLDVSAQDSPTTKRTSLIDSVGQAVLQSTQLRTPDARITLQNVSELPLLDRAANSLIGIQTGDYPRFVLSFWELPRITREWEVYSRPGDNGLLRSNLIFWELGQGSLLELVQEKLGVGGEGAWLRGEPCWGRRGVAVQLMGNLCASLYEGQKFDQTIAVLLPQRQSDLTAIWMFCSSPEFSAEVRKIDKKLNLTNSTLAKVPFDLSRWQRLASEIYPNGLPNQVSRDPTQWLFKGHPSASDQTLHVAVARLVGYKWPRQTGSGFPECPAVGPDDLERLEDADGIMCLSAINREQPAVNRLRQCLTHISSSVDERSLIAATGSTKTTLADWLRDEFFEQHCDLFHQRPFIWHIWDRQKDGFHALVNYHRLDHSTLQKLTYSYLGDWIRHQEEEAKADKPGADARLGAARDLQAELAKILEGESPHDIFVRWKRLSNQAIGWHPDLNDGVRLNIRPFAQANVLRKRVKIRWDKDRGQEPHRDKEEYPWFWCEAEPDTDAAPGRQFIGHRWNNVHLTIDRKRRARGRK